MKKLLNFLLLTALALTACGGSDNSSSPNPISTLEPVPAEYAGLTNPLGSDAAAEGAEVFQSTCAGCHGETGAGDGPAGAGLNPAPQNLVELNQVAGDDYLFWRINVGKNGTAMIGWKGILKEDQIWQVVSFIRTLK